MTEVGILVVDDDIVSQRALKNVLDGEGWRVRIVPVASQALPEMAKGNWDLAIVDTALIDEKGPLFGILRELAQAEAPLSEEGQPERKRFRVLFLVRGAEAKKALPFLEEEAMPYLLKPYHLHDFLEKVSELLVEAGAIGESMRGVADFSRGKRRKRPRAASRDARSDAMFAPREEYHMTEEEMTEFEHQEEEDKKKRQKDQKDRYH